MKLRIRGNSIRLRLGRSEARRLADEGIVEESTVFGPSRAERFTYAIVATSEPSVVSASFADGRIEIRVPSEMVHQWTSTDQVGMDAHQSTADEDGLRILIEKDFECVDAPNGQSREDAFPNPQLETARRPAGGTEPLK
jgi:hypothetical protein